MYYLIFFAQILLFYLTSRKVTSIIYLLLRKYLNKNNTLRLFSFFFLPGTFMHEASHYLTAKLLMVPAGDFNLKPIYEREGIQMGSVSIAKIDPIRRFVIGIAPVVLGTAAVLSLSYLVNLADVYWQKVIIVFFIFTIANSMFSSRKDMEGAVKLFITITFFLAVFYYIGVDIKLGIPSSFLLYIDKLTRTAVEWFILPLLINISVVLLANLR